MYDLLTQQNKRFPKMVETGLFWWFYDCKSLLQHLSVKQVYNYWSKKLLKFQFLWIIGPHLEGKQE